MKISSILFLAAGILLFVALASYSMKNSSKKQDYDEMQLKLRGDAYKISLFAVFGALLVMCFGYELDLFSFFTPGFSMLAIFMIGVVVFAARCIITDAFFSINDNGKTYIMVCIVLVIANGVAFLSALSEGEFYKDGVIEMSNGGSNLLMTISFLILLVAILAKKLLNHKEVADEES